MRAWLIAAVLLILPLHRLLAHGLARVRVSRRLRAFARGAGAAGLAHAAHVLERAAGLRRGARGVAARRRGRGGARSVAPSEHGADRLRRSAALVASAALRLDRGASRGARRRGDVIAGRAGRRRLGHRLADRARAASRPSRGLRSSTAGSSRRGWRPGLQLAAGSGLYFVAGLTYQTSALFAVDAARGRTARSRRHGSARGRQVGHHAHRRVVRQLGRGIPRDEPRVHRRCRAAKPRE